MNQYEPYRSTIPYRYNEVPDLTTVREFQCNQETDAPHKRGHSPTKGPVFYHTACWQDHGRLYPDRKDLLSAEYPEMLDGIRYSYVPSTVVDKWRHDRIRRLLVDRLPALFPDSTVRLPREIWDRIVNQPGRDLVRLCAAVSIDAANFQTKSNDAIVKVSKDIWAHYTFIDGVRYIARLTNDPPHPDDGEVNSRQCLRVFNGAEMLKADKAVPFYVLADHLGVRQIAFGQDDAVRLKLAGAAAHLLWVEDFEFAPDVASSLNLAAWSDGVKIRHISTRIEGDNDPYDEKLDGGVSLPASTLGLPPRTRPEKYLILRRPDQEQNTTDYDVITYMGAMSCNSPDTIAYSAFWRGHYLYAMHAHSRNEDPRTLSLMYRDIECKFGDGVWTHFPVAEDERLVDLFLIKPRGERTMGRTMFRTNHSRDMELGPSFPPHLPDDDELGDDDDDIFTAEVLTAGGVHVDVEDVQERHEALLYESYSHICGFEPDTPMTLDYTLSYYGAWKVLLSHVSHDKEPPTLAPDRSFANPRHQRLRLRYGAYMHSSVSLKGAVSVTPSYKRKHCSDPSSRTVLCGFMFHYPDDNQKKKLPQVLGEYRLNNMLGEPIDLYDAEALYFGFRKTSAYRKSKPGHFDGNMLQPPVDFVAVSTVPQESKGKMLWWRLPLAGTVEMWHSSIHSYILSPNLQRMTPVSQEDHEM